MLQCLQCQLVEWAEWAEWISKLFFLEIIKKRVFSTRFFLFLTLLGWFPLRGKEDSKRPISHGLSYGPQYYIYITVLRAP